MAFKPFASGRNYVGGVLGQVTSGKNSPDIKCVGYREQTRTKASMRAKKKQRQVEEWSGAGQKGKEALLSSSQGATHGAQKARIQREVQTNMAMSGELTVLTSLP